MPMASRSLLLVAAMLLVIPALAPAAQACSVPCGRIYPLILIQVEDKTPQFPLGMDAPVEIEATLTYKFDVVNEGYTAAMPNEPIVVTFEFPRKPGWAELQVEPERIEIPVNNPAYVRPDPADPTNPQASYVFTTPIKITATLTGQAILRDGYDYHKLLVFAKSTESGLYQSGYGIKEVRVVPEGALHEADVAGTRDVFAATPLPPLSVPETSAHFGGTTVTLTPPSSDARFWEPATFGVTISPAPAGRAVAALHDEAGALVALTSAQDASGGTVSLDATLVRPGLHTLTLTLLPEPGTSTPPLTYALDFVAGALDAEGHEFPKAYLVALRDTVPRAAATGADPLAQFERDIPFWAFDTAQSVAATLTLLTPSADVGRSAANLQFSLLDPDGNLLQTSSVDPTNPQRAVRLGSVPAEGWYTLRVRGAGLPDASAYDARVEVAYASPPQARNLFDGVADPTGGLLARAGLNLTLPVDGIAVWSPSDVTPALDAATGAAYSVTVYDANGTLAYASGVRAGAATFTPPAPGTHRAFVHLEPPQGAATPFPPLVRAFTFVVGEGVATTAQKFAVHDAFEAPTSPVAPSTLGFQAVPLLPGAGEPAFAADGGSVELVDADGNPIGEGAGDVVVGYLRVVAANAGPAKAVPLAGELAYAAPVTLLPPGGIVPAAAGETTVPSLAVGLALAAIGAVAVAAALLRRR